MIVKKEDLLKRLKFGIIGKVLKIIKNSRNEYLIG